MPTLIGASFPPPLTGLAIISGGGIVTPLQEGTVFLLLTNNIRLPF